MATRNDFHQRQRERERQQRIRAQRNKRIISGLGIAAVLLIIILIAVSCSSKKKDTNSQGYVPENANTSVTETMSPTDEPTDNSSELPDGLDGIPSAAEQNDLLKIIQNSTANYYAYLTFDDGPTTKITPQLLDTLRRYNVKATFFEVGAYIRKNPDLARRVHDEGHLISAHSDSHDYEKVYKDEESFKSELESCYKTICDITDDEPFRLFRFPGGSYNSGDHAEAKQKYKKTLAAMDYYYIDWNTLNGDAEGRTKDADGLLAYLKQNMPKTEGENIVVLMHDSSTKQATADALPKIIEYLMDEGYSFHRLDDIPYDASNVSDNTDKSDNSDNSSSKSN